MHLSLGTFLWYLYSNVDYAFVRLLVLVGFLGMPVMVGMALVAADGLTVNGSAAGHAPTTASELA